MPAPTSLLRSSQVMAILALMVLLLLAPVLGGPAIVSLLCITGLFAMVAIGLNLLIGYTGQISFGQNAFFAVGAYATGILTVRYAWPPFLALLAGMLANGLLAYVLGWQILRLRGHYLAMATLAVGEITYIIGTRWDGPTGGLAGIPNVPAFSIFGFTFDDKLKLYGLIWLLTLASLLAAERIVQSRVGRAWRAIAGNEHWAAALGVDVARVKTGVFVLSALYASVAGSLYAHFLNYVQGDFFALQVVIQLMAVLVVGGIGTIWGPIVGALVVAGMGEALRSYREYSQLFFGLLYAGVLLLLPQGVASLGPALWHRVRLGRSQPLNRADQVSLDLAHEERQSS
ncbi:MAG: branched-chain amino acid ABC transporter permease [Chloroflexi bacterium]|nr:branched-chain amino acid ABC transporter permease [Chloroflexota bacterium]